MVKLNPKQFKSLRSVSQSLIHHYEGPIEIIYQARKIFYRVDTPYHLKIHSFFHTSQLKPYCEDVEDKERGQFGRAQIFITPLAMEKQIEAIIDLHLVHGKGWNNSSSQFLVHWKGTESKEATQEKHEDLWQFCDKFHTYCMLCNIEVVAKPGVGVCTTPQGAILNSDNCNTFENVADLYRDIQGLEQCASLSPTLRGCLKTRMSN